MPRERGGFPQWTTSQEHRQSLPRERGGFPTISPTSALYLKFAPRARGFSLQNARTGAGRRCWRTTFWARTSRIVCVASRARLSRRLGVRSRGDCGTGFSSFALASVVLQGLNHERCHVGAPVERLDLRRPGGDDPRIAMGEPDVADAYRVGGSILGAAVFDRAGGVGPLRPAQRSPAQDGHRLRPADAGLPAPVAAGPGPGGGGRWRLRQARVPAALPEYVKADCRRHQTAQGRVPVPARATAAARPDRAAPGWSARDCPVPRRCWTIPLHNGFPTAPPVPTAVPPWSS